MELICGALESSFPDPGGYGRGSREGPRLQRTASHARPSQRPAAVDIGGAPCMPPAPIRVHDSVQHREERVNASVQRPWDLALHVGPVVSCAPVKGIRIATR